MCEKTFTIDEKRVELNKENWVNAFKKNLGGNLYSSRKNAGYRSPEQASLACHCSPSSIRKWEDGTRIPQKLKTYKELADTYRISMCDFFKDISSLPIDETSQIYPYDEECTRQFVGMIFYTIRHTNGLSNARVSELGGFEPKVVCDIERGIKFTMWNIISYASVLDVNPADILVCGLTYNFKNTNFMKEIFFDEHDADYKNKMRKYLKVIRFLKKYPSSLYTININ